MTNRSLIRSLQREYDLTMKAGAKAHRKGFPADGDALFEAAEKIQQQITKLSDPLAKDAK